MQYNIFVLRFTLFFTESLENLANVNIPSPHREREKAKVDAHGIERTGLTGS